MKRLEWTAAALLTASTAWGGLALTQASAAPDDRPAPLAERAHPARSAYLGVAVSPVDADTAKLLGMDHRIGLTVDQVARDAPAEAAGLKVGDVVTNLNDQLLINPEQFAVLVRTFEPGASVTLRVLREGETMQIEAELGGRALPELGPGGAAIDHPPADAKRADPFDALLGLRDLDAEPMPAGPDHIDQMIHQLQLRMLQQREEMDRIMQQMQEQMRQGPAPQLQPLAPGAGLRVHAQSTWSDGEHTLRLKDDGDTRRLNVTTQDGDVLFDGEVPDDGQIEGLPDDVQRKVDHLLKGNRIEIAPPPAPKPNGPVT